MNKANPRRFFAQQTCHSLNQDGMGVVLLNTGKIAFIPDLLPGEVADLELTQEKKNHAFGKVIKLHKQATERIQPLCPLAADCGGCTVQHLAYEAQLHWKENIVRQNLQRIGKFSAEQISAWLQPILGMSTTFPSRYRNKMQIPCRLSTSRQNSRYALKTGYFAPQSHRLIPHEQCLLHPHLADELEDIIRNFWQKNLLPQLLTEQKNIRSADILRHLLLRIAHNTNQVMVVLVLNTQPNAALYQKLRPRLLNLGQDITEHLTSKQKELTSFYVNFQTAPPPAILSSKLDLLSGKTHIQEKVGTFTYNISPHSFFQVNTAQTEVLYRKVLEEAKLRATDEVFDLYCGTGSISLFLAHRAKHVTGIEIVPPAIQDAQQNAYQNNLSAKTTFLCGPAERLGPQLCSQGKKPNVIVLDPPRKGCDKKLLQAICKMAPERLVYVSCDPATLARDLKYLTASDSEHASNYQVVRVTPVDLFPHSFHVETIALIQRVKS